jgi:hypothetical protein
MCYFILDKNYKTLTSIEASYSEIAINYGKEIENAVYVTWNNNIKKTS